jgi:hypothetical protein
MGNSRIDELISAPYSYKIMEIKFKPNMKDKVSNLMKGLHITSKRHSKYLVGLSTFGHVIYI